MYDVSEQFSFVLLGVVVWFAVFTGLL